MYFDVEDAKKYGVEEAILLHNPAFWVTFNKKHDQNFHDGHYWTSNNLSAMD